MVRAFLAIELSEEIRERLKGVQDVLRTSSARMTFVAPENIHITVKFLGEVDTALLPRVMDAIRGVSVAPFPVRARRVTVNDPKRPFTVWSTISDGGMCQELFCRVEDALVPLNFHREKRRFLPHATLARIKQPDPSLSGVLARLDTEDYGECRISGITLKKSTLTPQGPVYEDLLVVPW